MISHIFIRNIAIIREIDLDLREGLNILSGETGTGKSIIIQAISLALGGRSSTSLIAEDADRAMVQIVFLLSEEEQAHLGRFSCLEDGTIIFTRELSRNGRSLARINGEIVRLSELAETASHLIDIHGQYDNQFFLDPKRHIDILDSYIPEEKIAPVRESLRLAYREYEAARGALRDFRKNRSEYLRRMDFMRYEYDEIRAADPRPGEDGELEERMHVLSNGEKIYGALDHAYQILYDSDLEKCSTLLDNISHFHPDYKALAASVSDHVYALEDLKEEIRQQRDSASFSPEELNEVMKRLDTLDNLKRKYGGSLDDVLEHLAKCESVLSETRDADETENDLAIRYREARDRALKIAAQLTALRRDAAADLEKQMILELHDLSFSNVDFRVECVTLQGAGNSGIRLTENGTDDIRFLFSSNKGASLKPLSEIASGGEISRISLAFKNILSGNEGLSAMIFDEIDTGISGRTASVAGAKMRNIGKEHQILCITHLPQIAAAGNHHFLITKTEDDVRSYTSVTALGEEERIEEIARLLGGANITDTTRKSAAELLESFRDSDN